MEYLTGHGHDIWKAVMNGPMIKQPLWIFRPLLETTFHSVPWPQFSLEFCKLVGLKAMLTCLSFPRKEQNGPGEKKAHVSKLQVNYKPSPSCS